MGAAERADAPSAPAGASLSLLAARALNPTPSLTHALCIHHQTFVPVTLERPKALLPLCNAPLVDHALEWLAAAGVDEVVVFCCAHADAVRAHLAAAGWGAAGRPPRVTPYVSTAAASVGDALRALEQDGEFLCLVFVCVGVCACVCEGGEGAAALGDR